MEPYVARAFLNKLLSDAEKKDLKSHEIWLQNQLDASGHYQHGRYLTGSEICRRYSLKPDPLPESDTARMEVLLWQWRRTQSALFDQLRETDQTEQEPFNLNGDHLLGDLWNWEEYAEANYREILPQYPSMVCLAVLLLPLMLK